jgi:hypothetical protein
MDPETLIHAVTKLPFIVYSAIYAGGASVLATLSHGKVGQTWVFVDVGLCALFGKSTAFANVLPLNLPQVDLLYCLPRLYQLFLPQNG